VINWRQRKQMAQANCRSQTSNRLRPQPKRDREYRAWAYGPRPLFLAEYLKRLRANDGDDVLIGKVLKALQSEVMRRPEWADDERVKEQLKGEHHDASGKKS
jgi:hypothetical protein